MPQSNRKRFAGREVEILNYINNQGRGVYGAMDYFGAKDLLAWERYVNEISKIFNIPIAPRSYHPLAKLPRAPDALAIEKFILKVSIRKKIKRLEKEEAQLDAEIDEALDKMMGEFIPEEADLRLE